MLLASWAETPVASRQTMKAAATRDLSMEAPCG
jgi:hypothetical protein